jgi:hypothetical protein
MTHVESIHELRSQPSIIFFDGKGDEVGGMLFGVRETANGFRATRHFSFDANGQAQTLALTQSQDQDGSTSGLTISNRPKHSQLETFARLGLEPGATREQLNARSRRFPRPNGRRGSASYSGQRAHFSALPGAARPASNCETVEAVPGLSSRHREDGMPSIRVLDERGANVLRLPE